MRKVLMISHGYPPVGGSGMLRTLKFSHYLPASGWQPCVLTLSRTRHPRLDRSLLDEIPPATAIYRSPMIDLLGGLVRIRNLFTFNKLKSRSGDWSGTAWAPAASPEAERGLIGTVKDILSTPDQYASWYLLGVLQGLWVVLRQHPQAIFSTSPPPTAHLIGASLSRLTGLPWVADLRDPWTLQREPQRIEDRRLRWNRRLERKVFHRAKRIICNTDEMAVSYRQAYPQLAGEKLVVITNGFDPADFTVEAPSRETDAACVFTHAGEFMPLHRLRVPDPFLIALLELLREGRLAKDQVRVRLLGSGEIEKMEDFQNLVQTAPLSEVLDIVDFLPHDQIPRVLAESDVLLLFQNAESFRMQIPAKVYEYIRASRPILAIAPPGATATLIDSIEGGVTVHPDDHEGMKQAILDLISRRGALFERKAEELDRFNRARLTAKLGKVLDEITQGSNGARGGGDPVEDRSEQTLERR